jgi:hypothetical protein
VNILFWYMPLVMVSGAFDVMLPEREEKPDGEWPATPAERGKRSDNPAPTRSAA